MTTNVKPYVYLVGIDAMLGQAVRADLGHARVRSLPPATAAARSGIPAPALVVFDPVSTTRAAEASAAQADWGPEVLLVEVQADRPAAIIWSEEPQRVELAPGFLAPYVPAAVATAQRSTWWRSALEYRSVIYPGLAGAIALTDTRSGLFLGVLLVMILLVARLSRLWQQGSVAT